MTMKKNVGGMDRIIRIVAGLGIMSLAVVGPESPWAWLGAVPFLTGLIGWCPPYALLGISTCTEKSECACSASGKVSGKSTCCGQA